MFMISDVKNFQTSNIIHVKGSFGGGARSFSAPRVSVPRISVAPRVSAPRVTTPYVAPRVSAPRVSTPAPRVSTPAPRVTNNYYHSGYGYGYHPYYSHPGYYYAYHPGYWFSYNFWNYMWFSSVMNQQQQVVQQQYAPSSNGQSYPQTVQPDPNQQQPYQQPQDDTNYAGWAIAIAVVILGVFWWTRKR